MPTVLINFCSHQDDHFLVKARKHGPANNWLGEGKLLSCLHVRPKHDAELVVQLGDRIAAAQLYKKVDAYRTLKGTGPLPELNTGLVLR